MVTLEKLLKQASNQYLVESYLDETELQSFEKILITFLHEEEVYPESIQVTNADKGINLVIQLYITGTKHFEHETCTFFMKKFCATYGLEMLSHSEQHIEYLDDDIYSAWHRYEIKYVGMKSDLTLDESFNWGTKVYEVAKDGLPEVNKKFIAYRKTHKSYNIYTRQDREWVDAQGWEGSADRVSPDGEFYADAQGYIYAITFDRYVYLADLNLISPSTSTAEKDIDAQMRKDILECSIKTFGDTLGKTLAEKITVMEKCNDGECLTVAFPFKLAWKQPFGSNGVKYPLQGLDINTAYINDSGEPSGPEKLYKLLLKLGVDSRTAVEILKNLIEAQWGSDYTKREIKKAQSLIDTFLNKLGEQESPTNENLVNEDVVSEDTLLETYSDEELDKMVGKVYNIRKLDKWYRNSEGLFAHTICTKCGREKEVFLSNLINDPDKYGSCICSDENIDSKIDYAQQLYTGGRKLKSNTSGYTGVSFVKTYKGQPYNKWRAYIEIDGKRTYLGDFTKKKDAVKARKVAAEKGVKWYKDNRNKITRDLRRKTKKYSTSKYRDSKRKIINLKENANDYVPSDEFELYTAGYILENGSYITLDEYHAEEPEFRNKKLIEFSSTHFSDDVAIRIYKQPTEAQYNSLEKVIDSFLDEYFYCKLECEGKEPILYKAYCLYENAIDDDGYTEQVIGNWTGWDLIKIIKKYYQNNEDLILKEK